MDHDLVSEGEAATPKPKTTDTAKLRGKSLEMALPDMAPPANPEDPSADVLERYLRWKSEFMESAQRALNRLGLRAARVTDCRSLKHWNTSLYQLKETKHPQNAKEDAQWNDAFKRHPDFFDGSDADDDDFVILVEFGAQGSPEPMRIRKVSP